MYIYTHKHPAACFFVGDFLVKLWRKKCYVLLES